MVGLEVSYDRVSTPNCSDSSYIYVVGDGFCLGHFRPPEIRIKVVLELSFTSLNPLLLIAIHDV